MATVATAAMDALVAALAACNGAAGGYTYDLSATGRVREGHPPDDTAALTGVCVFAAFGDLKSEHGPQLGRYRRNLTLEVTGYVSVAADTPYERVRAAIHLLDDIMRAVELDRTLAGAVLDLIIEARAFDGQAWGIPQMGCVVADIQCYWHANARAGV